MKINKYLILALALIVAILVFFDKSKYFMDGEYQSATKYMLEKISEPKD